MLNLQSIYFGQKHPNFSSDDYDIIRKISRLEKKHRRVCEANCNGEGFVNGKFYRLDNKEAYIDDETNVFDLAIDNIEKKIDDILILHNRVSNQESYNPFKVEFQHDPRGATVKLYYEGYYIGL